MSNIIVSFLFPFLSIDFRRWNSTDDVHLLAVPTNSDHTHPLPWRTWSQKASAWRNVVELKWFAPHVCLCFLPSQCFQTLSVNHTTNSTLEIFCWCQTHWTCFIHCGCMMMPTKIELCRTQVLKCFQQIEMFSSLPVHNYLYQAKVDPRHSEVSSFWNEMACVWKCLYWKFSCVHLVPVFLSQKNVRRIAQTVVIERPFWHFSVTASQIVYALSDPDDVCSI